ncbi:MAG: hypothetical protein FI699_08265 [SAR202 cluster bacterium]|nr:hypothetical protein [SAR202 cluster bacterium]
MNDSGNEDIYYEEISMPRVIRLILYVALVAMLAGLFLPFLFGDDDLSGWMIWVYATGMSVATITTAILVTWFRKLIIWVDDNYVVFGYGRFRKRFTYDQIRSVKETPYSYLKYGGSGIRYARHGHRAWSVPLVHTGVEIKLNEAGKERTYYVSSRTAEELERKISQRLSP